MKIDVELVRAEGFDKNVTLDVLYRDEGDLQQSTHHDHCIIAVNPSTSSFRGSRLGTHWPRRLLPLRRGRGETRGGRSLHAVRSRAGALEREGNVILRQLEADDADSTLPEILVTPRLSGRTLLSSSRYALRHPAFFCAR